MMFTEIHTVCFTGHRHMDIPDAIRMPRLLEQVIRDLYARGARDFRTGGAVGFDTVAALKLLDLKPQLPDLRLILILPCRNQTAQWDEPSIRTYRYIAARADEVHYLYDTYVDGCMMERNKHLVNGSDVCVAYCVRNKGGSMFTAAYALKQGLELINLHDKL